MDKQEKDKVPLKEALQEPTIGLSFLEKLALCIIDAHPIEDGRTRDDRLRNAMFALRGEYYRHGVKTADDRLLLHWMAAQDYQSKTGIRILKIGPAVAGETDAPRKYESLTELARAALDRFDAWSNTSTERAQTQRLIEKYRANSENLQMAAIAADGQVHVLEHDLLKQIAALLDLTGTPFKVPATPTPF